MVDDHSCVGSWNGCPGMRTWLWTNQYFLWLDAGANFAWNRWMGWCLSASWSLQIAPDCFSLQRFSNSISNCDHGAARISIAMSCSCVMTLRHLQTCAMQLTSWKEPTEDSQALIQLIVNVSLALIKLAPFFSYKKPCREFAEVAFSEAFVLSEETKQKRRLSPIGLASVEWRRLPYMRIMGIQPDPAL